MSQMYMYEFNERVWHWMQAFVMLILILTGIEMHFPDQMSLLGFEWAVRIHTYLGFLLIINAILGLLYHVFSKEIKQFIPEPRELFVQSFIQMKYYLSGIFRNEPHPFEKTRQKKLNPLQKITYLMILNVLLPVQVGTGLLMWSIQIWPAGFDWIGGLRVLAPIHVFTAWLFVAFVIMHVYLTTTGSTPLTLIKAMITGWEKTEEPDHREVKSKS